MKISKMMAIALVTMAFCSCTWQYKTIEVEGEDNGDYYPMHIPVSDTLLNRMGAEGWELAAGYPIVSTTYADLGNKRIIIQLKSNARTSAVRYVFKKRNF